MAKKKNPLNEVTDAEIVQMLSEGIIGSEIAKKLGVNLRTLEARLTRIRDKALATNAPHLVGNYFRKKLIK